MMTGEQLHGFRIANIRPCEENQATAVELTHEKTGAQVFWLDNGEVNKLFAIAFKTLPEDDSGVFHIIEHSVLCGSAKYPVKEPFVALLKSSMQTFQNAMTYPDKTVYPVASRNEQDFMNLVSVYLDAVFAPRMVTEENIFLQEGWHLEENEGQLNCKGVVYNEMKGAMGGEDSLISRKMNSLLFPDTPYGFNSGGSPEAIRRLTFEQFKQTYQRFYHPSNARVYLDGAVPMAQVLPLLDSYFSVHEPLENLPQIPLQHPVGNEGELHYELGPQEPCENKGRLTIGRLMGLWSDRVKKNALRVVARQLTDSNEAPLKKAVLDSGVAQNITVTLQGSTFQPYLTIHLKDLQDGQKERALTVIRDAAQKVLKEGLDQEGLLAEIDRMEFALREPEEPQGLYRCIQALSGWLYGGDPLEYLRFNDVLKQLRQLVETDYYHRLVEEMFLDNSRCSVLLTLPSQTLGQERLKQEAADLQTLWEAMDDEARKQLHRRNKALEGWQQTPDSPQALNTLPKLPLSAVNRQLEWVETREGVCGGAKVIFHPVKVPGITYFSAYFTLTDCTLEELTRLSMLPRLFGKLSTRQHTVTELTRLTKKYTGRLSFQLVANAREGDTAHCTPCLLVKGSALNHYLHEALALAGEILTQTRFEEHEKIRRIAHQALINIRQIGVSAGHAVGLFQTESRYTAAAAVQEAVSGGTSFRWLKGFGADFENQMPALEALARRVQKENLCQRRLTLSFTGAQQPSNEAFVNYFPLGTAGCEQAAYGMEPPMAAAIPVPAQISYAVQAWQMPRPFKGSDRVMANLLSLDYYWNTIRVQGGAYGAGIGADTQGGLYTYTYRDPSPAASLQANHGAGQWLRQLADRGEALTQYIISTAAESDPLRSPSEKGNWADTCYLSGYTRQMAQQHYEQLLNTTLQDVRDFAQTMDDFARQGCVCIVGNPAALPDEMERMEL